MINLYRSILLAMFCLVGSTTYSQVNVQFAPEVYGRSVDGLMNASITSMLPRKTVRLNITVAEAKAGRVVSIQTEPFTLAPGNNIIPTTAVRSAKIAIGNNSIGNYIRQNRNFPVGTYDYTYTVISAASSEEILIDQNFIQEVTPPAPFDLVEPYNEDKICERRPMLAWQPSLPMVNGQLYSLILVEVKSKQNAVEALNYNLPIVNQRGILNNVLMYPPISKELTAGKKYAWQVTAYKEQTVLNRSEIWSFTVECQDSVANVVEDDNGYRDIEDLARGNYYVANGVVKFAVVNSYAEQPLKYSITCVTDPKQKIRSLPRKKLERGKNKINIDLRNNFSFRDNYSYLLYVNLPNGATKTLRFIYKGVAMKISIQIIVICVVLLASCTNPKKKEIPDLMVDAVKIDSNMYRVRIRIPKPIKEKLDHRALQNLTYRPDSSVYIDKNSVTIYPNSIETIATGNKHEIVYMVSFDQPVNTNSQLYYADKYINYKIYPLNLR